MLDVQGSMFKFMGNHLPSLFITFEGPEGSGKSTQAEMLAGELEKRGLKVRLTREPGGDPVSEEIRKILLDGDDHSVADRAELFLYQAARAQHVERVVKPCLAEGYIVICGRFIDSTVAYQGYGSGIDLGLIREMNAFATGGCFPDITFLMDIDAETGLKRQNDWNRMERKAVEYHQRVRGGFLTEAGLNPSRIKIIDASQDIDTCGRQILEIVTARL